MWLILGVVTVGSSALLFALHAMSSESKNLQYASFSRTFEAPAVAVDTVIIGRSYYVAGQTNHCLYFGSGKTPSRLIEFELSSGDTVHHVLSLDGDVYYRSLQVAVDSPYFYMADGGTPFIYRGTTETRQAHLYRDDFYFSKLLPYYATTMAVVAVSHNENTIEKVVGQDKPILYRDILEEQGEGTFSTDGMLVADHPVRRLVYLYFYRNEYLVLDTAMEIQFRGNTIDTISTANLVVKKTRNNTYQLGAPPLIVNKGVSVDGDKLYVHSNLRAKNESVEDFERHAVVDVYDLSSGTYARSFYVPPLGEKNMRSFVVVGKYLYGMHDGQLVTYRLNTEDIISRIIRNESEHLLKK